MQNEMIRVLAEIRNELIAFTQELVRIRSYSGQEEAAVRYIADKMKLLGFDEVMIDKMGNVLGRIGAGETVVLFDSHIDTVEVQDEKEWTVPPFSGDVVNGRLYGRGSVDMKGGAAASVYAAVAARRLGLDAGKTILVSCTVFEEDCDGENLKHLFAELQVRPDWYVTCEPSDNKIVTGHKGKAQVSIRTRGLSAHGSAPEKGKNAIYEMAEIIGRAERINEDLMKREGPRSTLVLSKISSLAVSLNAVPHECEIYLDRRMVTGETEAMIRAEMEELIAGKAASWEIGTIRRRSWTGMEIQYEPFHLAWETAKGHALTTACASAYKEVFGKDPEYDYWDFSTNAVTPVAMGIPSIGFGPGVYKLAHCRDENCEIEKIIDACRFYATLISKL